jgi:hypothetical protein
MTPDNLVTGAPYLASAATVVQLQKWLKTRAFYQRFVTAFPGADKWAHWAFAAAASLISAVGIHIAVDWNMVHGGVITATIPNLQNILHGLWDWFTVYILQHTIYEAVHVAPQTVNAVVSATPELTRAMLDDIRRAFQAVPTEEKKQ